MSSQKAFLHLDCSAFQKYFAGLEAKTAVRLYAKMVDAFTGNLDKKLEVLRLALEENRNQDAMVMAHQLKGSLLSIGGTTVAETFWTIESEVGKASNEDLLHLLQSKKNDLKLLVIELHSWTAELMANLD